MHPCSWSKNVVLEFARNPQQRTLRNLFFGGFEFRQARFAPLPVPAGRAGLCDNKLCSDDHFGISMSGSPKLYVGLSVSRSGTVSPPRSLRSADSLRRIAQSCASLAHCAAAALQQRTAPPMLPHGWLFKKPQAANVRSLSRVSKRSRRVQSCVFTHSQMTTSRVLVRVKLLVSEAWWIPHHHPSTLPQGQLYITRAH